jgi:glyoxylase-like metal-dependent hydrolase (beta-lactamase superfamily II)
MRVHHLNCATMCAFGGRLLSGEGGYLERARLVCHCLLVETDGGLVLVDTGLGLGDCADAAGRLGGPFVRVTGPRLDPEETAARQVERLGFRRSDVRHIVVTHLDLDHAGGLGDFPDARVHVHEPELDAALARATLPEKNRYRPAQWAHGAKWQRYRAGGERWNGFECVRDLEGLPPEVLLVPLVGHTRGHAGVAVKDDRGWLLHAGDAYFFHGEMHPTAPWCTPGLAFFQRLVAIDDRARRRNRDRLQALARDADAAVRIVSAHDPSELAREQAAAASRDDARAA